MTLLRRASALLLPLLIALASLTGPGRAQTTSSRFAFADTTLLRDTLGLHFDRLFELADSLNMLPDSLRALSIRYRLRLPVIVSMADSLGMPVDSLGSYILRERFNPLSASGRSSTAFHYGSTYNVGQTSSTWYNGSTTALLRGPLFVNNTTSINMLRIQSVGRLTLNQDRSSTTEAGYKFSPRVSLGAQADLQRHDTSDPTSGGNGQSTNQLQLSMRSRQQPGHGLSSDFNVLSGVVDATSPQQIKRGLSGDVNGRLRYTSPWFSQDMSGQLQGNLARSRIPNTDFQLNTNDHTRNARGTLTVQPEPLAGLVVNYNVRDIVVELPRDTVSVQQLRTQSDGIDGTMRLRRDSDHYLNLTGRTAHNRQLSGQIFGAESRRHDKSVGYDARWGLLGWTLDHDFSLSRSRSEFPLRDTTGGYGESLYVRTIGATTSRGFGARLVAKATARVTLSSFRYFLIGFYPTVPIDHDQYVQNYRVEGSYTRSERLNSSLALDVTRTLLVNLSAASSAANNEDHTYRAEWSWTYRLLSGLTATQRNAVSADYLVYANLPENNALSLNYSTNTQLNAVLTPRLTVDVTHNVLFQPTGTFLRQPDGFLAFGESNQSHNYTLDVRIAYTPVPSVQLSLNPNYQAIDRDNSIDGVIAPQRKTRTLNFAGGANLNVPLGRRGKLTGNIARNFRADRTTSFSAGLPQPSPASQTDFWSGTLELSWDLQ
jgi:hypothetical protein